MPTKQKEGLKPTGCAVVENANTARAVDGSKDRMERAGDDPMTKKPYFYRGGVAKRTPDA